MLGWFLRRPTLGSLESGSASFSEGVSFFGNPCLMALKGSQKVISMTSMLGVQPKKKHPMSPKGVWRVKHGKRGCSPDIRVPYVVPLNITPPKRNSLFFQPAGDVFACQDKGLCNFNRLDFLFATRSTTPNMSSTKTQGSCPLNINQWLLIRDLWSPFPSSSCFSQTPRGRGLSLINPLRRPH